jgi:hypothetical protein
VHIGGHWIRWFVLASVFAAVVDGVVTYGTGSSAQTICADGFGRFAGRGGCGVLAGWPFSRFCVWWWERIWAWAENLPIFVGGLCALVGAYRVILHVRRHW